MAAPVLDDAPARPAPAPEFHLGYRPALDGLRGLAVLAVLVHHLGRHCSPLQAFRGGFLGVEVFFVLSGFLITELLCEEWSETNGISLGAFYARRGLRLLPALILVLAATGLYALVSAPPERAARIGESLLITLFYAVNWFAAFGAMPDDALIHAWSLSIEEQFYLIWPLLLLALLRGRVSRRGILGLVGAGIAASAVWRAVLGTTGASGARIYYALDTHADALLMGCLVGLLVAWSPPDRIAGGKATARRGAGEVAAALGLAALFVMTAVDRRYLHLGAYTAVHATTAALLVASLSPSPGPVARVLQWPALVWVGRLSYGIYLWHYPIFNMLGQKYTGWTGLPLVGAQLLATLVAVVASYYLVERPALRLKRRFERGSRPAPPPVVGCPA